MEQLPGAGAPAQDQRQEPRQELVLPLELVSAEMLPDVGGKAANLGELMRAGLPVPAGFVPDHAGVPARHLARRTRRRPHRPRRDRRG